MPQTTATEERPNLFNETKDQSSVKCRTSTTGIEWGDWTIYVAEPFNDPIHLTRDQFSRLNILADRLSEYQQAHGVLREEGKVDRFCCLGVACELYRQESGGKWVKPEKRGIIPEGYTFVLGDGKWPNSSKAELITPVRLWYGFPWASGAKVIVKRSPDRRDEIKTLAEINDAGVPFDIISQLIRLYATTFYTPEES